MKAVYKCKSICNLHRVQEKLWERAVLIYYTDVNSRFMVHSNLKCIFHEGPILETAGLESVSVSSVKELQVFSLLSMLHKGLMPSPGR